MKKERATTSDEQRERNLIAEQIEKAAAEAEANRGSSEESDKTAVEEGLKRSESEKVVLSIGLKPSAPATVTETPQAGPSLSGGLKLNPLKSSPNPLKRPNVFKTAKSQPEKDPLPDVAGVKRKNAPMSAAEQLILEEQERKRRRMEREAQRP